MVPAEMITCNTGSDTGNDTGSKSFSHGVDNGRCDCRKNTCEASCEDTRVKAGDDISDYSCIDNSKNYSIGSDAAIVIENGKCTMYGRMLMITCKGKHAIGKAVSKTRE